MGTTTSKLGLSLPGGGSSGAYGADEIADVDVLNHDFEKVELGTGFTVCTSTTRPGSPYLGQPIIESDTGKGFYWTGLTWKQIIDVNLISNFTGTTAQRDAYWGNPGTGATAPEMAARVALAKKGPLWFNTDKGWEEQYFAKKADTGADANVAKTPGWYPSGRGLVPRVSASRPGTGSYLAGVSVITTQANYMSIDQPAIGFATPVVSGAAPGFRFVVPVGLEGIYDLEVEATFTSGPVNLFVKQNSVTNVTDNLMAMDSGGGAGSLNARSFKREVTLDANDFLILAWQANTGGDLGGGGIHMALQWNRVRVN